jgi:hypothetical protein
MLLLLVVLRTTQPNRFALGWATQLIYKFSQALEDAIHY